MLSRRRGEPGEHFFIRPFRTATPNSYLAPFALAEKKMDLGWPMAFGISPSIRIELSNRFSNAVAVDWPCRLIERSLALDRNFSP